MIGKIMKNYIKVEDKNKEIKKVRDILNNELIQIKERAKREKESKKIIEKKLLDAKNQVQELKKDNKELTGSVNKLKHELFIVKEQLQEKDVQIKGLNKQIDVLNNAIKSFEKENNENQQNIDIKKLKNTNERLINRVQDLIQQYNQLKDDYIQLDKELLVRKSLDGVPSKDDSVLENVKKELKFYKNKVDDLENNVNVQNAVNKLIEYLNEENLDEFDVTDKLLEKVNSLRNGRKEKELQEQLKLQEAFDNPVMGYIVKEKNHWAFYDLSNKYFEIIEIPDNLVNGVPAKAALIDSTATIMEVYSTKYNKEEIQKKTKSNNNKQTSKQKEYSYLKFGDFKVLIVGARNKVHYIDRLTKHGVEAIWHDPFEEHQEQLKSKVKSADIVLICKRHIPHDVTNIVNVGDDDKIQIIDRDNKETIAARTYSTAQKLGLIEEQDALSE